MSRDYFIQCLNVVYYEILNDIWPNSTKEFKYVKEYVFDYPTDPEVLKFKNFMLTTYQNLILNQDFINALNMSDDLKFLKIQEIYKNIPFIFSHQYYPHYFYSLIISPSEYYGSLPNFFKACYWFFKEENKCFISQDIINKIDDFMNSNAALISGSKDAYYDYHIELLKYRNISFNIFDDEFKEFKFSERLRDMYIDDYTVIKNYMYKKLGVIGELIAFNSIKNFPNANLVARDLGNGFGYDIYFQNIENNQIIENLFEVKTTTNNSGNDIIFITENEYNMMMSTINTNAHYYICRVFANIDKSEQFNISLLQLVDGNRLISILPNDNIEYYLENVVGNTYQFRRKMKKLELK